MGVADALKGQVPVALLVINDGVDKDDYDTIIQECREEVRHHVRMKSRNSIFDMQF